MFLHQYRQARVPSEEFLVIAALSAWLPLVSLRVPREVHVELDVSFCPCQAVIITSTSRIWHRWSRQNSRSSKWRLDLSGSLQGVASHRSQCRARSSHSPFLHGATKPLGSHHASCGSLSHPRTTYWCQAHDSLKHAGLVSAIDHSSTKTKFCDFNYVRPSELFESGILGTDSNSARTRISCSSSPTGVPMAAISALRRRRTFEYKPFLLGNLHIVRWLASRPITNSFVLLSRAEPSLTT